MSRFTNRAQPVERERRWQIAPGMGWVDVVMRFHEFAAAADRVDGEVRCWGVARITR